MNYYLDEFLNHINIKNSQSLETYKNYKRDLTRFLNYLEEEKIQLEDINKETMMDYAIVLRSGQLTNNKIISDRTYARNVSVIKSYFKYLNQHDYVQNNPAKILKVKNTANKLPEFLTFDQISTLINSFDFENNIDIRNALIIEMIYACGLRVSELVGIKWSDVDFSTQLIKVLGKGNKIRLVPFYPKIERLFNLYEER